MRVTIYNDALGCSLQTSEGYDHDRFRKMVDEVED